MKLRTGRENSVKTATFWRFRAFQYTCVQMTFYVEFIDTCYEKILKSKVPKMVNLGRKPKFFISRPILKISTDMRSMKKKRLLSYKTRENILRFDSPQQILIGSYLLHFLKAVASSFLEMRSIPLIDRLSIPIQGNVTSSNICLADIDNDGQGSIHKPRGQGVKKQP